MRDRSCSRSITTARDSVAESAEMAERSREPTLVALFGVHGVAEAILGEGLVLVRLGRLFRWHDGARSQVIAALAGAA